MAMREKTPHNEGCETLEECVRRQLAEIEVIYDTVPVGLCVFDRQGRYVRVNERLARNQRPAGGRSHRPDDPRSRPRPGRSGGRDLAPRDGEVRTGARY